ncbi:hypothetical protein FRB90_008044, partial [Tulasnella sp. 427]
MNEKGVQMWVELVALQTALRLLKSAEPELEDLNFRAAGGKGMQKALSDIVFERDQGQEARRITLLVEVKCPWTLKNSDLVEITALKEGLRQLDRSGDSSRSLSSTSTSLLESSFQQYSGADPKGKGKGKKSDDKYSPGESVLAQVYDYCTEQKH